MQENYSPSTIEQAAQTFWDQRNCFKTDLDSDQEKFYCLAMFPYPSGKLHMGHVRNYTIGDVISRYQRMQGKQVLQPMGWDAFGLPAENAAIKHNIPPAQWTKTNIAEMRTQLKRLGFAYDWEREIATCHPDYYRWEQWLFIQLYKKGLVYRKNSEVNWDPIDKTVLANEQVIDGRGWRSGALVERRQIPQWFLKITDYAEQLLNDLDQLTEWPSEVIRMQKHWIGRSEGVELTFAVQGPQADCPAQTVEVFTTRPDTLFGVTYVAIAPQHPLSLYAAKKSAAKNNSTLQEFITAFEKVKVAEADMATLEKAGVDTGLRVIHPLTQEILPVWTANFVLMSYGSGAVMSVPAHDQRDWEFAQKYQLPIKQVIEPTNEAPVDSTQAAFTEKGQLIHSAEFTGLTSVEAFAAIAQHLAEKKCGQRKVQYRLRDWGVSRQRYWGAPIPIIYCDTCGAVPVAEQDLPVRLPTDVKFDASGCSPLKQMPEFYQTTCPCCAKPATRETDTFDTFMESSWYYARYLSPRDTQQMTGENAQKWLPVNQYVGGIEHAVLHLLYSRFFHKLMRDEGLVHCDEPFQKLLCQGMVIAETFYREEASGKKDYIAPQDVEILRDDKGQILSAKHKKDQQPVLIGNNEKMSKSKNNGVDPQIMIDKFGADTVRLFIMFAAPPEQSLQWNDSALEGAHRFLKRVWRLVYQHTQSEYFIPCQKKSAKELTLDNRQKELRSKTHQTLKKAGDDMGRRCTFNTAIAAVMELLNAVSQQSRLCLEDEVVVKEALDISLLILSPIVPHIAHALWQTLGHAENSIDARWPIVDETALVSGQIEIAVQVNGKLRTRFWVDTNTEQKTLEALALNNETVSRFIAEKTVRKVIVVPNKLVNIVVA